MPGSPIKVLLQTTIPATADDWNIARFSLLGQFLREQRRRGVPLFEVTMRDRENPAMPDPVLSSLDQSPDHMDLGSSICNLGGVGEAHHFHSRNLDPDATRRAPDDSIPAGPSSRRRCERAQ